MAEETKTSSLRWVLVAIIVVSLSYIFTSTQDSSSRSSDTGLEIVDYQWKLDGDYIYITGRVDNKSEKTYGYFKVTANFLDYSGKIIESDFTNSAETLLPGAAKEFLIMHKYSEDYKDTKVIIEEAIEKRQ